MGIWFRKGWEKYRVRRNGRLNWDTHGTLEDVLDGMHEMMWDMRVEVPGWRRNVGKFFFNFVSYVKWNYF